MNPTRQKQAEELDDFITARLSGLEPHPAQDRETELASQLADLARSAQPDPAFARQLEAQLYRAAKTRQTQPRAALQRLPALPRLGWLTAGVVAAVAVAIVFFSAVQAPTVSAGQIMEKAKAAAALPANGGIQSLEMDETTVSRADPGNTIRTTARIWFQSPNRWRVDNQTTVTGSNGQVLPDRGASSLGITDATTIWFLDRKQNKLTIAPLPANASGSSGIAAFGAQPDSIEGLFAQASSCYDPRLRGSDTVAGRAVYVVDLGVMKCATGWGNGPSIIWVDKATFIVLKHVQYAASGSEPIETTEVSAVRYNQPLDSGLFTLTAPAGATVQDFRAKPAPSAEQYQQKLSAMAAKFGFPIFVPSYVPAGLEPRAPLDSSIGGVELDLVPAAEVEKPSAAILSGLLINEQQATYELVTKWTEGAKPVQIPTGQAWLRTDAPNPNGGGMDKAAYVLRDGTIVSIASFQVSADELVKVAASLQTVAGSHSPLANPTAPVLAQLRQRVSFPIFVPTAVPAGLTPEPPLGGDQPGSSIEIDYHAADGSVQLLVVNGPAGCCDSLRTIKGQDIHLSTGVTSHLIIDPENPSSWTLWWEQDGTVIKLSGPNLTQSDLIGIGNSTSKTADLGQTQPPPVRPTAASLPAPKFQILQPAWLPEAMTRQQDYQAAPPEIGSWVVWTFLPTGADMPRTPLLLMEKPQALMTNSVPNPQASIVKIGNYSVTVTRTESECSSYDWDAGSVHLTLQNSYNMSGAARYTCDQMTRIIESIQ